MNSKQAWLCLIYSEIAFAIFLSVGIARWYGLPDQPTCHQLNTTACSVKSLTMPTGSTNKSQTTSTVGQTADVTRATEANAGSIHGREIAIVGWATWYSTNSCKLDDKIRGIPPRKVFLMANNKPLNDHMLTCALPTNITSTLNMKFGQRIHVTNLVNGHTVLLTYTDRGPGRKSRSRITIADLTPVAFAALGGNLRDGKIKVKIQKEN
jgi:rare lipoprotein A (peptidoglycan hydrolase)